MPAVLAYVCAEKSYMRCLLLHTTHFLIPQHDEVCRRRCLSRPCRHGGWVRCVPCIDVRCENVCGCAPSYFDVHVASGLWCTRSVVRSPHDVDAIHLDERWPAADTRAGLWKELVRFDFLLMCSCLLRSLSAYLRSHTTDRHTSWGPITQLCTCSLQQCRSSFARLLAATACNTQLSPAPPAVSLTARPNFVVRSGSLSQNPSSSRP